MKKIKIQTSIRHSLADTITPVSIYLKIRDVFPDSILLESSDYHGTDDSYSFICLKPMATFMVQNGIVSEEYPDGDRKTSNVSADNTVTNRLQQFISTFEVDTEHPEVKVNGLFGYTAYDAVKYFEKIELKSSIK